MVLSPASQQADQLAASSLHPLSMLDHPFDSIHRFCSGIGYPRTSDRCPPTRIHTCRLPLSASEENEDGLQYLVSFFSGHQGCLEISKRYFVILINKLDLILLNLKGSLTLIENVLCGKVRLSRVSKQLFKLFLNQTIHKSVDRGAGGQCSPRPESPPPKTESTSHFSNLKLKSEVHKKISLQFFSASFVWRRDKVVLLFINDSTDLYWRDV